MKIKRKELEGINYFLDMIIELSTPPNYDVFEIFYNLEEIEKQAKAIKAILKEDK
jgi:hypothetical protein